MYELDAGSLALDNSAYGADHAQSACWANDGTLWNMYDCVEKPFDISPSTWGTYAYTCDSSSPKLYAVKPPNVVQAGST